MSYSAVPRNEFIVGSKFQTNWIEGSGFWLLAAIYLGGAGGGLYISVFFALYLVIYTGFVLLASRPIFFWNSR